MLELPRDFSQAFLQCEFCGRYNGDFEKERAHLFGTLRAFCIVWENHFEQHLTPPRQVDICDVCHIKLHRYLTTRTPAEAEELLKTGRS